MVREIHCVGYVNTALWLGRYTDIQASRYTGRQAGLSIYINNCFLKVLVAELAGQQAAWKVRFRRGRILKWILSSGTVEGGLADCGSDRDNIGLPSARH